MYMTLRIDEGFWEKGICFSDDDDILYEELNESSHLLFGEKHHAQKKKFCAWHTW